MNIHNYWGVLMTIHINLVAVWSQWASVSLSRCTQGLTTCLHFCSERQHFSKCSTVMAHWLPTAHPTLLWLLLLLLLLRHHFILAEPHSNFSKPTLNVKSNIVCVPRTAPLPRLPAVCPVFHHSITISLYRCLVCSLSYSTCCWMAVCTLKLP